MDTPTLRDQPFRTWYTIFDEMFVTYPVATDAVLL